LNEEDRMQETTREEKPSPRLAQGLAGLTAAAAIPLRLMSFWPNFTPLGALTLFGGARLRFWQAVALPLAAWLASDLLLWWLKGYAPFNPFVYTCFLLNILWGRLLLRQATPARVTAAALLSSGQFFAVTNFGVWLTGTMYPHTAAGLLACYAAGLPFARYTLLGDLCFSALLFGVCALVPVLTRRPKASQPV
jgi:hypothetical protein